LIIVLLGGVLAGTVAAAFAARIERSAVVRHGFQDLAWGDLSFARAAVWCLWLVPLFLLIWLATNYYVHRRTGGALYGLLLRDAPCFLAGAPLVGALVAFGPADGRPDFLTTVGLLYLAVLVWKFFPMLKAVLSGDPIRLRDVLAAVLAVGLGLFVLDHPRRLDGDEPHYLVFADSLLHGRGADLGGSYDGRVTARFFRGPLVGHTVPIADPASGKLLQRPGYYPGLPALALPGYALAGASGAKLVVALFAAAGLTGLFALLRRLDVSPGVAARGVILLACTSPFITYALQLYPEIIAAAALTWCLVLMWDERFGWRSALAVGALASALPWLHIRYAPLSAALMFGALVRSRLRATRTVALILPALASAAGLFIYFRAVYGGFVPGAVCGLPENLSYIGALSLRKSATYFFAMFLDSHGGVFAYAPILALAPLGAALLWRKDRAISAFVLLLIALEVALIAAGWRSWHGDWSPPSRFLACVCPLPAALAVAAYQRCRGYWLLRRLSQGLFALGVLFGLLMIADPDSMYNARFAGSLPAITESYRWIRLGWVFPDYADAGARTIELTLFWIAAIVLLTWLSLRTTRDCGAGVNRGPGAASR